MAILPYLHPSISTALMRPRRPKQYCLQLVIFIFIYSLTQLVVSALANLKLKIFCVDARNKVLVAMMYIRKIENTGKIA